jgi:hypothetical protein
MMRAGVLLLCLCHTGIHSDPTVECKWKFSRLKKLWEEGECVSAVASHCRCEFIL